MNLIEKRAAALKAAQDTVDGAKAASRDMTSEEAKSVEDRVAEVKSIDEQIKAAEKSAGLLKSLGELEPEQKSPAPQPKEARTLGDHFAKSVGELGFLQLKTRGRTVDAPEYKAASDVNTVGPSFGPVLTDVDQTIVRSYRRPTVSDLLGTGSISGTAVTYYVEGAVEGAFSTVAEGGQKPQIHIVNPTPITDKLSKIAAWFDTSDEMVEDVPFFVSEINNRGLYLLSLAEEAQLLSGDGTGTNITGVLNRSGIQVVNQAATGDTAQDTIFRALTAIETATGLTAEGIIINPVDYQALRLAKDANQQYYGGGFFSGEYGNGGVVSKPPLWGVNTVVSAAVPAKTVVVGAFKAATTVYRKGGVRVESTNSDAGKFTKNIITTRIEERLALAVRIPSAIAKVTLV
ncbi:phage major capsid protein [Rathayibacter sp. AY2B5]|uniref:phage major capsid protein n=1 Tax=Rathayibacter sp. AY2B5 TaxID=2080570 RepID=UPI000CE7C818|nr:phage major capsid protein [Rathayibacter sp. AY2B5]PPG36328.1 phage major capsid protein [Rathayibacter sp. AY2B5]